MCLGSLHKENKAILISLGYKLSEAYEPERLDPWNPHIIVVSWEKKT